ncbi:PucR family transcriptional regulator ligand-binding domain-containing protein [Oceanobacillus sp. FSL K6-2867]|uniref:PucR family transcriptional regulator n=1 Tax=Oceanobacillus sp. FSL K6-2867 TaxID=2954748 RepID=UPI0030DDD381
MRLTMEGVLNREMLENAKIITGENVVSERYVQWISVIELPVENFVRKNEAVLTTAIGCSDDVTVLKGFVQDIIDAEASALLIATGRYIFDIPSEVIELAEKHDFIIVELPWEIRFASIVEEIMKEINDIHYKEREKSEKVQQEFFKLILKNTAFQPIAKFIQRKIGCSIVITNRTGEMQEKEMHTQTFIQKWEGYVLQEVFPVKRDAALLTRNPMFQKFHMVEVDRQTVLQLPVLHVLGEPQGYFFVIIPPDTNVEAYLTPYRVNVLEHAATTIALWFSRKNAIEETKMRLHSDFVQELAKGEFMSYEKANARATLLGYRINLPYVCMIGIPENLRELFRKQKQAHYSYENWLENMILYIREEIFYAAQSLNREVMMTYQDEQLLLFIEIPCKNENATSFLDLVERRLGNLLPGVVLSWGIGSYREGYQGFSESYQHAGVALTIGRRKKGIGHRMLYEHTRVDRVLLNLVQNQEMKEIVMTTIEQLVQYDEQRNMDLIGTFRTFNKFRGNVSQTARVLNLHRQSLLYRLRKIESLTGLSLVDPDDLFLLDLSIRSWRIGVFEQGDKK